MSSKLWLYGALVLSIIVATLQQWAMTDFLYWRYEWFDVMMHFLGGLTIGVLLVALLRKFRPFTFIILFILVAVGWEVFEYMFGVPHKANYVFDTSLDFVMDVLGATAAYVAARYSVWRSV